MEQLLLWDQRCFLYLNGLGNTAWDPFFLTVTLTTIWFPLFLYFFWLAYVSFDRRTFYHMVLTTGLMVLFVALLGGMVKYGLGRPRPYQVMEGINAIRALKAVDGPSFFSGHAASSFAIVSLLWLFFRKQKPWFLAFFLWPFLYSFSRIYIGVHYPLDILFGAFIGVFSAWIFYRIYTSKLLHLS